MYYVNPDIKELYRVKFHDERRNFLRLDMNENPEGLPYDFVEEVKKKITPEFLATYPEKDKVVSLLAECNGINKKNISITSGSDEAMRFIFQCFGEKGKVLLTVTPTFEMYDVYSKMFGMEHKTVEYNPDFTLSFDNMISLINENTGIVILLNPNSPIGACWTENEAEIIIKRAAENNAIVVIDEAYYYFYESTFMPLINKYDNLLVIRTFSKLYSCAGLRIGYVSGNETLIHYIENAESTFNVNNVALLFAEELLKRPDIKEQLIKSEAEGREWLTEKLKKSGYNVFSHEGNYILFMPNKLSSYVVAELKKLGIWVRDYSRGFLKGWIRVSTGSVDCMKKFYDNLLKVDI